MKRLFKVMLTGTGAGILLMSVFTYFLYAQTGTPLGGSFGISNSKSCTTPALGYFGFCKPSVGGPVQWTDDGSAYAPVSFSGTPGPAGPPGPTGATGAQGIPGPNWTTCTGATLTPTGVVNGIVQYTLAVNPTNCH